MTILSSVMGIVKEWFGKYLYFSKATMCIRGLVFSHSLVDHAIMCILIMYIKDIWENQHFQLAAVVTNVQDGLSSIMVIVLAHLPDTYNGYFKIIVTTNAAYVVGLGILWSCTVYTRAEIAARVFYGAIVLLTLGEAGRSAALNEFLDEQYLSEQDQTECIDDKKLQDRQKALWSLPWFLGAVVVIVLSLKETVWEQIIKISTVVMGVFYLLFWFGYFFYFIYGKSPRGIEADPVYPIEEAKRDESCIDTEENHIELVEEICKDTEQNYIKQVHILEVGIDTEELAAKPIRRGKFWGVIKKMKDRKHFRNEILAIWLTFLVYSVVRAAGNTFFFEQMDSLRELPIKPIAIIFYELDSLLKYITSHLWDSLPKKWKSNTRVRIGCGMVCTVLCCVVAWQVEIRRLNEAKRQGAKDDPSKVISMSIFWLVPQFSLLGIMEGLAVDGLIDFFVD